ncbi:hypothetical protein K3495_g6317 [Podosphaera aphanis]|nr:hypothetical protein K3495_g6317 [Podosphaera aphanis]
MLLPTLPISLITALLFTVAEAAQILNDLSFGAKDKISQKERKIPNFQLLGSPNSPELLSNKVVLTPPAPGNARGAIWSEKTLEEKYWAIDLDFRATGPERGGGNIQIWYVRNGQQGVGTSSIYTVGNFDGLALSVDQYAGSGGSIRGFLNDGTTDYKSHHNVDSLSFGRCDYPYRNLGRPLRIHVTQLESGFHVLVDGKECFSSNQVILPTGNNIGVTAASTETPDSVEIFKLVTLTDTLTPSGEGEKVQRKKSQKSSQQESDDPASNLEEPITSFQASAEQFKDLHYRLQMMMKQMNRLNQVIAAHQSQYAVKYDELIAKLHSVDELTTRFPAMDNTLKNIQTEMADMRKEFRDALNINFNKLKVDVRETHETVRDTHHSLHGRLLGLASFSKIVFLVVGSQAVLILGFVLYKNRKGRTVKKYL